MGRNKRQKLANLPPTKTKRKNSVQRTQAAKSQQNASFTIPFEDGDEILLVGEGDFSFARSLAEHHECYTLTATSYDSEDSLLSKYPQAREHIQYIVEEGEHTVLHGIDGTKLGTYKALRRGDGFDRVVFNFPHVGGKTKDVNRQVRYNQELLVGFFKAATPLLKNLKSTIIVTVFEGEPYTLWNIKDLARHVGLKVGRSFKFHSEAYPGYKHARTIGNIDGGGGWKGETRSARTYIFQAVHAEAEQQSSSSKRKRQDAESDSDDSV